jgi:hypothetical protein
MAAKRYHQSKKDRMDESRGMEKRMRGSVTGRSINYPEMKEDRYGEDATMVNDLRRKHEHDDGRMISEDHSAIANLPQDVKYHEWPKAGGYTPEGIDDTIKGINRQLDSDSDRMHVGLKPRKA